jgi:hypothetical protein
MRYGNLAIANIIQIHHLSFITYHYIKVSLACLAVHFSIDLPLFYPPNE